MSDDASLRGDCGRCIGLCCVGLAFDRGPQFAFDKSAGEACQHLDARHSCTVHDRLESEGLGGCARYDCRGAGQIVAAAFAGLSWRDSPAIASQMFLAFAKLREVQTLRAMLGDTIPETLAARLSPPDGWSLPALLLLDVSTLRAEARSALLAAPPHSRLAKQAG